jgi:signal transduction histidine kinase
MTTEDRRELGTDELDLLTQTGILIGGSVYLSQLIRELEEQRAIAIEASRLKSEFLANTSHELRTPLTSILGFLRLIIDGAVADTDKQHEFLEIAHESAEQLLTIINDVLDLAKIEAGRLEVHLAPTRITKVLADIEALFRHQMRSKGLTFEIEKPDTDFMLWADPNRTIQILTNLLSNSLKFTPRGGTVNVSVDGHDQIVTFFVRDSGIGISPDELGKVFASFYQVDGSTTRHYGGTGLGLTISRRLASLMNGHLELTSAGRNQGVTAVLKLCEFTGEDSVV